MKHRILTLITLSLSALPSLAEGYLPNISDLDPSGISTRYFGPNAFPVPDMAKTTDAKLGLELGGSYFQGFLTSDPDRTANLDFKARIPLWTDRVNLTLWGQYEWYWDNPAVRAARNVNPAEALRGAHLGDVNFSVDMRVLNETPRRPSIVVRAACKTAAGGEFYRARYYDSPGYFFDACVAKNLSIKKFPVIGNARPGLDVNVALSAGFLCWQVGDGRQNDAVMYGAGLGLRHDYLNLNLDLGGYVGWKNEGDKPMVLTLRVDAIPCKMFSPYFVYKHGFRDWPFDQYSIGIRCSLDVLKKFGRQL